MAPESCQRHNFTEILLLIKNMYFLNSRIKLNASKPFDASKIECLLQEIFTTPLCAKIRENRIIIHM